jgi:hypothetical protein
VLLDAAFGRRGALAPFLLGALIAIVFLAYEIATLYWR